MFLHFSLNCLDLRQKKISTDTTYLRSKMTISLFVDLICLGYFCHLAITTFSLVKTICLLKQKIDRNIEQICYKWTRGNEEGIRAIGP